MFDDLTRRITIDEDGIPNLIWIALFGLICIAMIEVGYLLERLERANWVLLFTFLFHFQQLSLLLLTFIDSKENISINNKSVKQLYKRIHAP